MTLALVAVSITAAGVARAAPSYAPPYGAPYKTEAPPPSSQDRGPFGPWLEGEVGVTSLSLRTLAVDEPRARAGMERSHETAPALGAAAGVRLAIVTLGARARVAMPDRWDLWTAGGELGVRVPVSIFEPAIALGGGYAAIGNVKDADAVERGIAPVTGYYARVGAGLGVHATRVIQVGAQASWEILALTPRGVSIADVEAIGRQAAAGNAEEAWNAGRKLGGTGYGSALTFTASVSARF